MLTDKQYNEFKAILEEGRRIVNVPGRQLNSVEDLDRYRDDQKAAEEAARNPQPVAVAAPGLVASPNLAALDRAATLTSQLTQVMAERDALKVENAQLKEAAKAAGKAAKTEEAKVDVKAAKAEQKAQEDGAPKAAFPAAGTPEQMGAEAAANPTPAATDTVPTTTTVTKAQ